MANINSQYEFELLERNASELGSIRSPDAAGKTGSLRLSG
jgi:hypothetical protein